MSTVLCEYPINRINEICARRSGPPAPRHLFCHFNDQSLLEYNKAMEQRRQLKEDHVRLIQEEAEKMERDLAQEELPVR